MPEENEMTLSLQDAKERAARGAGLLDERIGPEWPILEESESLDRIIQNMDGWSEEEA